MSLLSVAEAQARLLALATPLPEETVPLSDAAGRWAARDVVALRTQPAADLSAMDGYALRFAELPGPWTVIGESAAGRPLGAALSSGEAARIFTGAPVPEGADTILIQEEAGRDGPILRLAGEGPPRAGAHVRTKASDFAAGDILISAGASLTPARIALAAVGGHGALAVRRRVRVALISTGSELTTPGASIASDELPASNAPMLAAMLASLPVAIEDHGIVPDDLDALAAAFGRAGEADIIVSTGGASVGDHDLVRPALERAGATLDFWKVAMKPGKPLMAGRIGPAIALGLPGNPVSAFVTATLFLKPLIAALGGGADPLPATAEALLGEDLPATGKRAEYPRGRWRDGRAIPVPTQDSAALVALAEAELLIVRPPMSPAARRGDPARIIALA